MRTKLAWLALPAMLWIAAAAPDPLADLRRQFERPPDDARIMMRWWWFGPAVTKPELEREMRLMKEGGIGGFEVQTVYPLELDGNFPYLSDEFLDALRFTGAKARELGLRYDLTLASGWPYGGPHIPLALAAPRLRIVHGDAPQLADGETLVASFPGRRLYFVASHTRMMVKRAAVGAEGFVLNHYDRAAIEAHLRAVGDRLAQSFSGNPPHAIFSDSLEVERSDWTGDFPAEFRKRRGYDLTPYLPALAGDIGEKTMAIRHDWGRTLTELANENYLQPLTEWAHRHGTLFRSQTYGTPPVNLSSNALVDLPEGEGSQWRRFSATRWASSASHLYGRPVTSSETWTWLHSPVFRATPLDMKAEADIHFLEGINQLVGHGWPYSPPSAGEPGWRFYAAAVFNQHNPWWMVMPDIALYLQRISFLLRQGQPANDVAVYLPTDDAYAAFTPGSVSVNKTVDQLLGADLISKILDAGYDFDFIDDGAIAHGGVPYRILILPNVERIPLATYRKIEEYAGKGGTPIFTGRKPSLAPGVMEAGDTPAIVALSEHHQATDLAALTSVMHAALPADVATAPEIGFVHRKLGYADIYFLVNTSNHRVHAPAVFRSKERAESWDPVTGKTAAFSGDLDLAPYESRVLVFSKDATHDTAPLAGPSTASVDLNGKWTIAFPGEAPSIAPLHSWTDDEAHRYFSGLATYETSVGVRDAGRPTYLDFGEGTPVATAEHNSGPGMRAMLEAPVREAAIVYINGKRAGSLWCAPYRVDVTGLLKAGENRVRIEVANLAINELAKGPLPDYKALNAKYGERFQPQDMAHLAPLPSGILGPVRLVMR
ncbi:MAG TPA: glycosyl hydrolase [Bryobacteraceae bacterium]|nr:glycosyl hydrolase [Bryobacteraceae bacterium]